MRIDRTSSYGISDASGYASNNTLIVAKYNINIGFDLNQHLSDNIQDNFNHYDY